jgi:phosphatidylinositol alpha-1,6-mannosyltransferase
MKILFYAHEFPTLTGGAGRFSYSLAFGLNKREKVIVLTHRFSKEDKEFDKNQSFKIIRIFRSNITIINYLIGFLGFVYVLVKLKPKIIFATDIMSQRVISIFSFLDFKNLFVVAHGSEVLANFNERRFKRWLFTKIYSKCQHIISNSTNTKELLERYAVSFKKITIINPGIDIEEYSKLGDPSKIRKKYGLDRDKVILTLARLSERKGQDKVLEALPIVVKKIPNVKYIIAGDGENLLRLKKIIKHYNLDKYVIFAGHIPESEVIDYYDACDVFVLPNRQVGNLMEGFGIVFIEASARGKPVIGGNNGGVSDAIVDGETGFLVNPEDAEEISGRIIDILSDGDLAVRMGLKGRERSLKYFTYNNIANEISNLIKESN